MRFPGLFLAALVVPLMAASGARADTETNAPNSEKGAFSILFENDIFDNTDHDYTNGVELGYTTSPNGTPDWAVSAARALPFFDESGGDVRTRYAIGQAIFTQLGMPQVVEANQGSGGIRAAAADTAAHGQAFVQPDIGTQHGA